MKYDLSVLVFDMDGTLYNKARVYNPRTGSVQDSQDFFRYNAFSALRQGADPITVSARLIAEYKKRLADHTLLDAVRVIPNSVKTEFATCLRKHGSNGKVFIHEFGLDPSYLQELLTHTDFAHILRPDPALDTALQKLKPHYRIGAFTSDMYATFLNACQGLKINPTIFNMTTGTKYPILCGENVTDKKPSEQGFQKILQIYRDVTPDSIAYIGDHLQKDIIPALRCGMQALHIVGNATDATERTWQDENSAKQYLEVPTVEALQKYLLE
ncbi:MAG: HAD family hydrolase [Nanoarchaeota archaeon]